MQSVLFNDQTVHPSKVVCIGRNYIEHARELGNQIPSEPVIFIKPNSAISNRLLSVSNEPIHYESEIAFMVFGNQLTAVGFGLDLTKRKTQQRLKAAQLPWERAKAFDGAAVFSQFVAVADEDIEKLELCLHINDTVIQRGHVSMMQFKPKELLEEVRSFLTFEDGDILMTGTPAGVGEVNKGDLFNGAIRLQGEVVIEQQWYAI